MTQYDTKNYIYRWNSNSNNVLCITTFLRSLNKFSFKRKGYKIKKKGKSNKRKINFVKDSRSRTWKIKYGKAWWANNRTFTNKSEVHVSSVDWPKKLEDDWRGAAYSREVLLMAFHSGWLVSVLNGQSVWTKGLT